MSRIGKLPIQIPSGVTITVADDALTVVGPKGQLVVPHLSDVTVSLEDGNAIVTRKDDERIAKAQHGLQRALLNNAVDGVTKGFEKKLEVNGVGFRVSGGGKEIEMALGFSHPVGIRWRWTGRLSQFVIFSTTHDEFLILSPHKQTMYEYEQLSK